MMHFDLLIGRNDDDVERRQQRPYTSIIKVQWIVCSISFYNRKDFSFRILNYPNPKLILFSNQTEFPNEIYIAHCTTKQFSCRMWVRERVHLLWKHSINRHKGKGPTTSRTEIHIRLNRVIQPYCFFICSELCGPCEKTPTVHSVSIQAASAFFRCLIFFRL